MTTNLSSNDEMKTLHVHTQEQKPKQTRIIEANLGSQSEIILWDIPCLAMMVQRNNQEKALADIISAYGTEYTYLYNQSTIVHTMNYSQQKHKVNGWSSP